QQDLPGEAGGNHRAPQSHDDPPAGNRVYGAGIRLRATGNAVARQAGGIAMKPIAALAAWLLVAAASPIRGAPGRDGEVKAVSVLPAPGRVEVVIDLRGAVDVQDFTLARPPRLPRRWPRPHRRPAAAAKPPASPRPAPARIRCRSTRTSRRTLRKPSSRRRRASR